MPGNSDLRTSCTPCYDARKKCSVSPHTVEEDDEGSPNANAVHRVMDLPHLRIGAESSPKGPCSRCLRLNIVAECIYEVRRKPGPKNARSGTKREAGSGTVVYTSKSQRNREKRSYVIDYKENGTTTDDMSESLEEIDSSEDDFGPRRARRPKPSQRKRAVARNSNKATEEASKVTVKQSSATRQRSRPHGTSGSSASQRSASASQDASSVSPPSQSDCLIVATNISPSHPLQSLPSLPDEDGHVHMLLSTYFGPLYFTFPSTIRSYLLEGLTRRTVPDFLIYTLLFWTSFYALDLQQSMGRRRHRQSLLALYGRMNSSLMPSLEIVLSGYEAFFASEDSKASAGILTGTELGDLTKRKLAFKERAVAVVMSLIHLLSMTMLFKT